MTAQRHENGRAEASSAEAHESAPDTFYGKNALSFRPVPIPPRSGSRCETGTSRSCRPHGSAALALKEVGERLARGEKAAAYLAHWERADSEGDPRLKETP